MIEFSLLDLFFGSSLNVMGSFGTCFRQATMLQTHNKRMEITRGQYEEKGLIKAD